MPFPRRSPVFCPGPWVRPEVWQRWEVWMEHPLCRVPRGSGGWPRSRSVPGSARSPPVLAVPGAGSPGGPARSPLCWEPCERFPQHPVPARALPAAGNRGKPEPSPPLIDRQRGANKQSSPGCCFQAKMGRAGSAGPQREPGEGFSPLSGAAASPERHRWRSIPPAGRQASRKASR